MNLDKLKQQYGEYFLPGGLFLGGLILLLALGLTSFSRLGANTGEAAGIAAELPSLHDRLAAVKKLSVGGSDLLASEKLIDSVLPSEGSVPIVMTEVQQIAGETGVTLTALQFSEGGTTGASAASAGTVIRMQTAATGSYSAVQAFLKGLETAGRLLMIDSLRFSAATTGGQTTPSPSSPGGTGISTPAATAITITLNLSSPYYSVKPGSTGSAVDLNTPEFTKLITLLKTFKIYSTTVDSSGVGKSNPFVQ